MGVSPRNCREIRGADYPQTLQKTKKIPRGAKALPSLGEQTTAARSPPIDPIPGIATSFIHPCKMDCFRVSEIFTPWGALKLRREHYARPNNIGGEANRATRISWYYQLRTMWYFFFTIVAFNYFNLIISHKASRFSPH